MSASGSAQSRAPQGEPRTPGSCDNGLRCAGDPLAKHPIDAGLPRPRLWLAQVVRQPVRTRLRRIRRQCASRRRASSLNRGALGLRSEPAAALSGGRNAEVGDERARRHSLTFQSTSADRDVTYAGSKQGRPERHVAAQPSGPTQTDDSSVWNSRPTSLEAVHRFISADRCTFRLSRCTSGADPSHTFSDVSGTRPAKSRSDSYRRVIGVGQVGSLADDGMEP